MKKSLVFLTFVLLSLSLFSMSFSNGKTKISVTVDKVSDGYQFTVVAPTEGWVSIGFDASSVMKDSESIILTNANGKGQIYHYFGTDRTVVVPISKLDSTYKNDNLTLKDFSYDGTNSTYVFIRTEKVKNAYIKELSPGKKVKVLFAYSKSQDIKAMHEKAGTEKITLPN